MNELWSWECDKYYRRRQRTRAEKWRKKALCWRMVSFALAALLALAAVSPLLGSTSAEDADENATETPQEEPRKEEAPVVQVIAPPQEARVRCALKAENATVSHYCICKKCCGKSEDHPAYGITASGRKAVPYYSVAVDPYLIPLGSEVHLEFEDGERLVCRADDTGSAITGTRIDLCVSDHQEALNLGLRKATVYVVEGDATIDKG